MSRQYFGTDGIRGTVGQSPMVPDFVLRLGQAAGTVLALTQPEDAQPQDLRPQMPQDMAAAMKAWIRPSSARAC